MIFLWLVPFEKVWKTYFRWIYVIVGRPRYIHVTISTGSPRKNEKKRLLEVDHCMNSSEQKPPLVCRKVWSKINCMNIFIFFYKAIFTPYIPKHPFGIFAQKPQFRWSASCSQSEPESTYEASPSIIATGWLWQTLKLWENKFVAIVDLKQLRNPLFCDR